jgi:hypothetical protein
VAFPCNFSPTVDRAGKADFFTGSPCLGSMTSEALAEPLWLIKVLKDTKKSAAAILRIVRLL